MRPKVFKDPVMLNFQIERELRDELKLYGHKFGNVSKLVNEAIKEKIEQIKKNDSFIQKSLDNFDKTINFVSN